MLHVYPTSALSTIFWPGITSDIDISRSSCRTCHQNSPSQARLPPKWSKLPTAPFEQICADFFKLSGHHYLVLVDRLSGWPEVVQIKQGTSLAGAKTLCKALRRFFATFGVPEEIATDGGPEFVALETKDFYKRWGVKHRLSSAYHPQSNGRAELAVKSVKRLLEENVSSTGDLNTDRVVCALLQFRNTPDRDCNLSPAQILFGRQLKDGIPQMKRSVMIFQNNQLCDEWHSHWETKENALRSRLIKNCERLEANAKTLDPLREGDVVLVQNQLPNSPRSKKWDRQGLVVSTGENDQYLVKIAGSGRLTLRNRQFLRKFQYSPLKPANVEPPLFRQCKPVGDEVPKPGDNVSIPNTPQIAQSPQKRYDSAPVTTTTPQQEMDAMIPTGSSTIQIPYQSETPTTMHANKQQVTQEEFPALRRSSRIKQQTKFYDASTGE